MTGGLQSSAATSSGRGSCCPHCGVKTRAGLDNKPEAVQSVHRQEKEPEVKGDACQGSKVDPFPAIRLLP